MEGIRGYTELRWAFKGGGRRGVTWIRIVSQGKCGVDLAGRVHLMGQIQAQKLGLDSGRPSVSKYVLNSLRFGSQIWIPGPPRLGDQFPWGDPGLCIFHMLPRWF